MNQRYFPFHELGLRGNPFRALTDDEWADIAILPDEITEILTHGFTHLQILGERGHGKTTILLALAARFKREGIPIAYEYLREGQTHFVSDTLALNVFLLDEAQRLDARERKRLLACANDLHLVLGSHVDLTHAFAPHALTTLRLDSLTREHLTAILQRRLDYFALNKTSGISFTPDAITYLHEHFDGNLRAIEHLLYEVLQRLERAEPITVEHLHS